MENKRKTFHKQVLQFNGAATNRQIDVALIVVVDKHQFRALRVAKQLLDAHRVSVSQHRGPRLHRKVDEVAQLE